MATIAKGGKVTRFNLSIGSSNYGDFEDIKALVDSQGTGKTSILYKDFVAIKKALPLMTAVDFDDENGYDSESTIKFAVMLGKLGYHVTMNPYTNASYWISVVKQINNQLPGTVDGIHLQTFAGGEGNNPCVGWDFGTVPVYPGLSDQTSAPPLRYAARQQRRRWPAGTPNAASPAVGCGSSIRSRAPNRCSNMPRTCWPASAPRRNRHAADWRSPYRAAG